MSRPVLRGPVGAAVPVARGRATGAAIAALLGVALAAACSSLPGAAGRPQPAGTLGGNTCVFADDRKRLKWEVESPRDAPEGRLWIDAVDLDGTPVEVLEYQGAPPLPEGQPAALRAGVPFRFTLTLGPLPRRTGRLQVHLLLATSSKGARVRVSDSWCTLADEADP
jgi:hypothetical protein